jgi:hypothetical protein
VAYILKDEGIMADVQLPKLFANITDILNANLLYWSHSLYPMLYDAMNKKRG